MVAAPRERNDVIHREFVGNTSAVGTTVVIGCLNVGPLLGRKVANGGIALPGLTEIVARPDSASESITGLSIIGTLVCAVSAVVLSKIVAHLLFVLSPILDLVGQNGLLVGFIVHTALSGVLGFVFCVIVPLALYPFVLMSQIVGSIPGRTAVVAFAAMTILCVFSGREVIKGLSSLACTTYLHAKSIAQSAHVAKEIYEGSS